MYFSENVRYLRHMHGYSQDQLAGMLGYRSFTTIQKWESGKAEPSIAKMIALAELLHVSADDLCCRDLRSEKFMLSHASGQTLIPVYGKIPAGIPLEAIEDIRGYIDFPQQSSSADFFALEISGDSMLSEYRDGDVIIFEKTASAESGSDCAVRIHDEVTFKRIRKHSDCIILQPLNPDFEPIQVSCDVSPFPIEILGVARELRRRI